MPAFKYSGLGKPSHTTDFYYFNTIMRQYLNFTQPIICNVNNNELLYYFINMIRASLIALNERPVTNTMNDMNDFYYNAG